MRKRGRRRGRRIGKRVVCSVKSYKMSTKRGPRCVAVCSTPGGWKIPRFRKSSSCARGKARSWKSIRGAR